MGGKDAHGSVGRRRVGDTATGDSEGHRRHMGSDTVYTHCPSHRTGISYGGYATLVGLSFTPDVFKCGVDAVGPANLVTLLESIPSYWESGRAQLQRRLGGDPATDAGVRGQS